MTTPNNGNNEQVPAVDKMEEGFFGDQANQASTSTAPSTVANPGSSRSYDSFARYIKRVQKQIFPDQRISSDATNQIDKMVKALLMLLSIDAHELAKKDQRVIIQDRDIRYACRLLFPPDLAEQANKVGDDAVARYLTHNQ